MQVQVTKEMSKGDILRISKPQLSNKTTDFKRLYVAWKQCFQLSGFGSGRGDGAVHADGEVWDNHIKVSRCPITGI